MDPVRDFGGVDPDYREWIQNERNSMKKLSVLLVMGLMAAPWAQDEDPMVPVEEPAAPAMDASGIQVGAMSIEGFVDMSATYMDSSDGDFNAMGASLDQFELDFTYRFSDMVSARADLEGSSDMGNMGAFVEQGYITLVPAEGLSINVGRFLSVSGFETEEPTGLFQYSTSKNLDVDPLYGHYQNGLGVRFSQPMFSIYGSVVTNVWTYNAADTDLEYPGFEGQIEVMPVEGLIARANYLVQTYRDINAMHVNADNEVVPQHLINAWLMYAHDMVTVAGEFNYAIDWAAAGSPAALDNGMGWIAMANVNLGQAGITVRYSGVKWEEADDPDTEITVAPSVAVSDHLSVIAEYKREIDMEKNHGALEFLFTF